MQNKVNSPEAVSYPVWGKILPYAVIAIMTAGAFAGSLRLPFLTGWDDPAHIVKNTRLAFSLDNVIYWFGHDAVSVYMPFTMLSYMFDHGVWGLNPTGYRITTLLLHIIAAWGVYKCFRYYRISAVPAIMFSVIFAIHPQRVESVVWISERKDVLCAAFYFWSVFWYLRSLGKGWKHRIPAFLLCFGALLSKPMAASLPFVFLCIEFHCRRDFKVMYYLKRLWAFGAVTVGIMIITVYVQIVKTHIPTDFFRQALVVACNVERYVAAVFYPVGLLPIYPRIEFTASLLTVMTAFYLLAGGILYKLLILKGRQCFLFDVVPLIMVYLFSLAPVAGFLQVGYTDYADRYSYIPSVFVLFIAALALRKINGNKIVIGLQAVFVGVLIGITIVRMGDWRSVKTVLARSTEPEWCNDMALFQIGLNAFNRGDYAKTFESVRRLKNYSPGWLPPGISEEVKVQYLYLNGLLMFRSGKYSAAYTDFTAIDRIFQQKIMRQSAILPGMLEKLFQLEMMRKNNKRALLCLSRYLVVKALYGKDASYYFYSGTMAMMQKNYVAAVVEYKRALEIRPGDKIFLKNYQRALNELKKRKNGKQKQ